MKLNYILCAILWALLGTTAICGVWTPSPMSYGILAFALAFNLIISAFEK